VFCTASVRQLIAQRQLCQDILDEEAGPCGTGAEADVDELGDFLSELCRMTEAAVLGRHAASVRDAGDEDFAVMIENYLE